MAIDKKVVEETLLVTGLDCPDCASKVGSAIRSIEGVVDAQVNFSASTLAISFEPEITNRDRIVKAVENFGYEVTLPQRSRVSIFMISGID